jgi:hypothetical protein
MLSPPSVPGVSAASSVAPERQASNSGITFTTEPEAPKNNYVRIFLQNMKERVESSRLERIAYSNDDDDDEWDSGSEDEYIDVNDAKLRMNEEHAIKQAEIRWKVDRHHVRHGSSHMSLQEAQHTDPVAYAKQIDYQRIRPTLQSGGSLFDSPEEVGIVIARALQMRQRYMRVSGQRFPDFLEAYLDKSYAGIKDLFEKYQMDFDGEGKRPSMDFETAPILPSVSVWAPSTETTQQVLL